MTTLDSVLDSLKRFDIDEAHLRQWEEALGLNIPVDAEGRKQYSPHHINLFKNIKKHLALGRTLEQIRQIIALPAIQASRPGAVTARSLTPVSPPTGPSQPVLPGQTLEAAPLTPVGKPPSITNQKKYASVPSHAGGGPGLRQDNLIQLVERLMAEKDQLNGKLVEAEKLNSHLYNVNNLFNRKVKELSALVTSLKAKSNEEINIKLMDDKAKLHKQLLELEKQKQLTEKDLVSRDKALTEAKHRLEEIERQYKLIAENFDPALFIGSWTERSRLLEVCYDNFGINIESERARKFIIDERPLHHFGNATVIHTQYEYETNALWRRNETLFLTYLNEARLEGELIIEYVLDGVPVAKALYRAQCERSFEPEVQR
ncbi:MAG: MerR family transcriptional regulator [Candidatus Melainabacteria bacterium]|nr:MerR family transcriptional regulator [Candidatus Melainabacteria bacterium]